MPRALRGRFEPLDHFVLGHLSILGPLSALGSPHAAKRFIGLAIVVRGKDRGSFAKATDHREGALWARKRELARPRAPRRSRLLQCCERILHPMNCVPEKQLAGLGVLHSFSGLKTVLGKVLAQLNL